MWSENGPCYIIAEAGSNHDGDFDQAVQLIQVAADAGADAVKFQCLDPFERDWMISFETIAGEAGLDFLATPFDLEAVELVAEYCPAIKIASPEIVNLDLVGAAFATERPLILSTGMTTVEEIWNTFEHFYYPAYPSPVALLQCTTRYPAAYEQINLRAMAALKKEFEGSIGLSDHSLGIAIPIAAAALGARIIEKHFTTDKTLPGPDHHYALEPDELRQMVEGVRQAEAALGSGEKGPQEGELVEARGRQLQWTT